MSFNAYSTVDTLPLRSIKITPWQAISILADAKFTDQLKVRDTLQAAQLINADLLYYRALNDSKRKDETMLAQDILIAKQDELLIEKNKRIGQLEIKVRRSVRAGRFKFVLLTASVIGGGYLIFNK